QVHGTEDPCDLPHGGRGRPGCLGEPAFGPGIPGVFCNVTTEPRPGARCNGDEWNGRNIAFGEPWTAGGDPRAWEGKETVRGTGNVPGAGEKNSIGALMIRLKDILYRVALEAVSGGTHVKVAQIRFDSRAVGAGDVFVAIRGSLSDGHDFIAKAVDAGALAVVCEEFPEQPIEEVCYVKVSDSHAALAVMAANFYGHPSKNLKLVGITGTNGKTTVSTLLYRLFKMAGYKVGLISTIKVMVDDREFPARHTTP